MRKLAVLLAVIGLALAAVVSARAAGPTIYVQNNSTTVTNATVADALPAFQAAIDHDFAPAWNAAAELELVDVVPNHAWSIELVDSPNCFFCAGFHDLVAGAPYAQVGVEGDWAITFTHELFEVLADPYINRGVLVSPRRGVKKWYALEACDPVEQDALAYTRPSASGAPVHISDFILESWFRRGSKGPWDFTHATKRPLQVLKDGYQLVWTGSAWSSLPRSKIPRL